MLGAHGDSLPPDEEIRSITYEVKDEVEKIMGGVYSTFEPIDYTRQTVAGVNYRIRVDVGQGRMLNVLVFKGLPHTGGGLQVKEVTLA